MLRAIGLSGLVLVLLMNTAYAVSKRPPVTQIKTPHLAYRLTIQGQESHTKHQTDVDGQYWDENQVLNHMASMLIYLDKGNSTVFGKGNLQTQVAQRTMKAWWGGCQYNGDAPHTQLNNTLIGYDSVDANTLNMKVTVGVQTPFRIPMHCKDNPPETVESETISDQFVDRPFHLPLVHGATTTIPVLRDDGFDRSQGSFTITLTREPSADKLDQSSPELQQLIHPSGDYSDSDGPPIEPLPPSTSPPEDLPIEPLPPQTSPPDDLPLEPIPNQPNPSSNDSGDNGDNDGLPLTLPPLLKPLIEQLPSVPTNPLDMELQE